MKPRNIPRAKRGQFNKGASGNPSGRPVGSRNKTTLLAEQLLEGEAEELIRKTVELAKKGNIQALRFCLDRVLPIRKERLLELELPPAKNAPELAANFRRVLAAVGEGQITPAEAQSITELLNSQARALELVEMELRVQTLEDHNRELTGIKQELLGLVEKVIHEDKPKN